MADGWSGGCQCGAVRFRVARLEEDGHLCHCRMCQKAMGNLFAALVGVRQADLAWTRGAPARWRSSDTVERGFCRECGTPLLWDDGGAVLGLAIGAFDRAGEVPIAEQSDSYGRHPALGLLPALVETHGKGGPNPAGRQHPDHDT